MPTPPYAQLTVAVNGGAPQTGKVFCNPGDTIQFGAASTVGWTSAPQYQIVGYPPNWATPAGWSVDGSGNIVSTASPPPAITLPGHGGAWGKWIPRLIVNNATVDPITGAGLPGSTLVDKSMTIVVLSPSALYDMGKLEDGWVADHQANLRRMDLLLQDFGTLRPSIIAVTPAHGPLYGGTAITITGAGFVAGGSFSVQVNGVTCPTFACVSSTTVTAVTPAGVVSGGATITVINNDGQTATALFTYDAPALDMRANQPSTITSTNGVLSAWGPAITATGGPLVITDTVTGNTAIRTGASSSIKTVAGVANFLSQAPSTLVLVWRTRKYNYGGSYLIVDTTSGGTVPGYQLEVLDDNALNSRFRRIVARVYNGTSWIADMSGTLTNNNFISLKWHVVSVRLSSSSLEVRVDGLPACLITFAAALPASVTGPLIIGNGPEDFQLITGFGALCSDTDLSNFEKAVAPVFGVSMPIPLATNAGSILYVASTTGNGVNPIVVTTQVPHGLITGDSVYNQSIGGNTNANGLFANITVLSPTTFSVPATGNGAYTTGGTVASYKGFPHNVLRKDGSILTAWFSGNSEGSLNSQHNASVAVDGGTQSAPTALLRASSSGTAYVDLVFSKPLSDGSIIASMFEVNNTSILGVRTWRSADGGFTWGAVQSITTPGAPFWTACAGAIFEDPANPGHLFYPIYWLQNNSDAYTSSGFLKSTDNGATWPTKIVAANGMTDSIAYSEPQGLFVGTEIRCHIRDDTNLSSRDTHSTDGGTTWAATAATGPYGHSAGQSYTHLQLGPYAGMELWCFRPQVLESATMSMRPVGSAWNAAWNDIQAAYCLYSQGMDMTYAGIVEIAGDHLVVTSGRVYDTYHGDVLVMPKVYPWYSLYAMPATITAPFSLTAASTKQIVVNGAGDFTYAITTNNTGGIISSSGLYTGGLTAGTDTITCTDLNGATITTTATVTNTVTSFGAIDSGNLSLWLDPAQGVTTTGGAVGSGAQINFWTSADGGSHRFDGQGVTKPTSGTSLNGHYSVDGNGTSAYMSPHTDALSAFVSSGAVGWTAAWVALDTGSPADTGIGYENSPIFGDLSNGQFYFGTTNATAFAGQDGNNTHYDHVAQTGGVIHYYVAQYSTATGKVTISVDGGPFDAGTTVGNITNVTGSPTLFKALVTGNLFKGACGDIGIWKATESPANVALMQNYMKTKYGL